MASNLTELPSNAEILQLIEKLEEIEDRVVERQAAILAARLAALMEEYPNIFDSDAVSDSDSDAGSDAGSDDDGSDGSWSMRSCPRCFHLEYRNNRCNCVNEDDDDRQNDFDHLEDE